MWHLVLHSGPMPTKRPRHTLTETEPIAAALRTARPLFDPHTKDSRILAELIVLGAERKAEGAHLRKLDSDKAAELRERFLRRTRDFEGLDRDALSAVRERGWTRPHGR